MLAGSLSKRMVKLSRRLHKAMDGTPHVDAIAGKLDSIEKSMDDAQASIAATAAERFNAKRVGETAAASSEADSVKKAANEASSLADKKASDAKAAVSEAKKNSPKSHAVLAKSGDKVKLIRFGQQGVSGAGKNPKTAPEKARKKSFKARHAKNISKGKMSAAYWSDKVKW